jgi:hypothetical protein
VTVLATSTTGTRVKSHAPFTEKDDDGELDDTPDTEDVEFGKAEMVLRSPLAGDSPENRDKFLQSQLAQLFEKCGVPHNFSVAGFASVDKYGT